jgi:hypothetical protein
MQAWMSPASEGMSAAIGVACDCAMGAPESMTTVLLMLIVIAIWAWRRDRRSKKALCDDAKWRDGET